MKLPSSAELQTAQTRYGKMVCFKNDDVITRSLTTYGEWAEHEISILKKFIKPNQTVIDVGANIGTHSVAFAAYCPEAEIVAIEAQPLASAVIIINCALNGIFNVEILNYLCGNHCGKAAASLNYSETTNFGAISFKPSRHYFFEPKGETIKQIKLDSISFPKPVSLIKIDVEGMELDVLKGSKNILRRWKPVIYFEQLDTKSLKEIFKLLSEGYILYWLETHQFNKSNFNRCEENIWWRTEMGIVAIPKEEAIVINLPVVTGDEVQLPFHLNAREGIQV